jgi:Beta-galactosidase
MSAAGIEYVRMGEFSWATIEPERGQFEFEWLDEAIDLIGEHGMKVILCTPTATPPKWLVDDDPSILQQERDGTVREFGSRRHYCFNSSVYREETRRIVTHMAERYAENEHVFGWQTDNEFGCHWTVRCYCDDCASAFRDWLRDRFGDIDALNEAWGNSFWSQQYASFEEVDPPGHTAAEQHPSRLLEYYRFANQSVVDYNQLHASLLRGVHDDWFVTHNFMGHFSTLDAYSVSEALDLVSWDSYPTGFVQDRRDGQATPDELRAGDPDQVSFNHDLYRSALDRPFWVMEQQPGDVNWPPHCPQPGEGAMRLWAHQATAHGADAVLYFRWRRCLEGQEQYHAGLLKQDGTADRGYHDATQAAEEFRSLGEVEHVDADVALLHDYDNLLALSEQPHAPDFNYWSLLDTFYGTLRSRGIQVDIVHPRTDLSGYDAVVAPALHLVTQELAEQLTSYVEAGGHLLCGPRTGVKDRYNKLRPAAQPGPLSTLVGATVDQHESLPPQLETVVEREGESYEYRTWAEWLNPGDAEPLYRFVDGPADGRTAVTDNSVGDGSVIYCGIWPETELASELIQSLLERADIQFTDRLPDGIRITERAGYTWILNFTRDSYELSSANWLIGDSTLEPFDISVTSDNVLDTLSITQCGN